MEIRLHAQFRFSYRYDALQFSVYGNILKIVYCRTLFECTEGEEQTRRLVDCSKNRGTSVNYLRGPRWVWWVWCLCFTWSQMPCLEHSVMPDALLWCLMLTLRPHACDAYALLWCRICFTLMPHAYFHAYAVLWCVCFTLMPMVYFDASCFTWLFTSCAGTVAV